MLVVGKINNLRNRKKKNGEHRMCPFGERGKMKGGAEQQALSAENLKSVC